MITSKLQQTFKKLFILLISSNDTGKINASDNIMFENQKKGENMEIKDIFT